MTDRIWLSSYPLACPPTLTLGSIHRRGIDGRGLQHACRPGGYSFMGKEITYAQTDSLSSAFAAYLQGLGLAQRRPRPIMMPNVPQYPGGGWRPFCVQVLWW